MKSLLFLGLLLLLPVRGEDALDTEYASQTGTAITIIFDNSGSMEGPKLTNAKQAFKWWLEKAPDGYTWSLIDFDNGGKVLVPFTPHARQKIVDVVNTLEARTNTPIVNSLKVARQQIEDHRAKVSPYQRQVVLLFTDGEENQDAGGDEAVLRSIREMRSVGIEVVGIGYQGDGDYLAQAATRYYQANSAEALRSGLSQVDAEVDLGGEVNVTPEDLKAMTAMIAADHPVKTESKPQPSGDDAISHNATRIVGSFLAVIAAFVFALLVIIAVALSFVRKKK